MLAILLIGLVLAAVAVTLIARAATLSRVRVSQALDQIEAYGFETRGAPLVDEAAGTVRTFFDGVADTLGAFLTERLRSPGELLPAVDPQVHRLPRALRGAASRRLALVDDDRRLAPGLRRRRGSGHGARRLAGTDRRDPEPRRAAASAHRRRASGVDRPARRDGRGRPRLQQLAPGGVRALQGSAGRGAAADAAGTAHGAHDDRGAPQSPRALRHPRGPRVR